MTSILLLAAWSADHAHAATFAATVRATSGTTSVSGPTDLKDRRGSTGWQLSATSAAAQQVGSIDAEGSGHALAWVAPGGLQLRADAGGSSAVVAGSIAGGGSGTASGSFDDSFTVFASACSQATLCGNGRKGTMSFAIAIEGDFGGGGSTIMDGPGTLAGWSVSGGWSADVRVNGGYIPGNADPTSASWAGGQSRSETSSSAAINTGTGSFALRQFTVAFAFGQAINVHLAGSVNASSNTTAFVGSPAGFANASSQSGFASDLSHTIAWAGISEVRDASGQLLADWTALSSGSGFNYALPYVAAVPEPGSAWLMVGGLAWLLGRRRRRG